MHERFEATLVYDGARWRSAAVALFSLSLFTMAATSLAGPMTVVMTEPPKWASVVAVEYASTATLSAGALMWACAACCAAEAALGRRPPSARTLATVLVGAIDLYPFAVVSLVR